MNIIEDTCKKLKDIYKLNECFSIDFDLIHYKIKFNLYYYPEIFIKKSFQTILKKNKIYAINYDRDIIIEFSNGLEFSSKLDYNLVIESLLNSEDIDELNIELEKLILSSI
jgi:hypothetical protein